MKKGMLATLFSRELWMFRPFLWLLFLINAGGTVYGYIWYQNQLVYTYQNHPLWQLVFVPDSPTASLLFTIALLGLLFPTAKTSGLGLKIRSVIQGLAVVCSVKYGIWAIAMIVAGVWQGDSLHWTHYMLIASHLGMAVEALIYYRFMHAGRAALAVGLIWLLLNDTVDYTYGVFPNLSHELYDDLKEVEIFTYLLSLASFAAAYMVWWFRTRRS